MTTIYKENSKIGIDHRAIKCNKFQNRAQKYSTRPRIDLMGWMLKTLTCQMISKSIWIAGAQLVQTDLKTLEVEDQDHLIPADRQELERRLTRHACKMHQEENWTTASP